MNAKERLLSAIQDMIMSEIALATIENMPDCPHKRRVLEEHRNAKAAVMQALDVLFPDGDGK